MEKKSTHDLLGSTVVGQTPHPDDDLGTAGEEGVSLAIGATRHRDEILTRGLVDLDVALADVVLVPLERHVPVFLVHESHQSLAVAPALRAQTQCHAAPKHNRTITRRLPGIHRPFDKSSPDLCKNLHDR